MKRSEYRMNLDFLGEYDHSTTGYEVFDVMATALQQTVDCYRGTATGRCALSTDERPTAAAARGLQLYAHPRAGRPID